MKFADFTTCILLPALFSHRVHSIIEVGGYHIADSCTHYTVNGQTMATSVYFAIQRLQDLIRTKVIHDIDAKPTTNGYKAFFKTESNKPIVKDLLTRVANGDTFLDRCLVAPTSITIDCVAPYVLEGQADRYFDLCNHGSGGMVAFFMSDFPNIMRMCPQYFALPPRAKLRDCPSVRRNKMAKAPDLILHQIGVLIHELAHKYGASGEDEESAFACKEITEPDEEVMIAEETFAIQDCVQLEAQKQIKNAQNYAYYVSCELTFSRET